MSQHQGKLARRTLLQLIPASLMAHSVEEMSHCGAQAHEAPDQGPYVFRFFSKEETTLLDAVMEAIIPADEHSPGAHAAKTVEFADLMVSTSPEYVKQDWRAGLMLLEQELKRSTLPAWLEESSATEGNPQTVLETFFRTLKQMTINGYYSSAIGIHNEMRYQGNTYVAHFTGCEHDEHKA